MMRKWLFSSKSLRMLPRFFRRGSSAPTVSDYDDFSSDTPPVVAPLGVMNNDPRQPPIVTPSDASPGKGVIAPEQAAAAQVAQPLEMDEVHTVTSAQSSGMQAAQNPGTVSSVTRSADVPLPSAGQTITPSPSGPSGADSSQRA